MERQIKAVVFDMDGVLLDSETISLRTWNLAAQEFCIPGIESVAKKSMGMSDSDIIASLDEFFMREGFPVKGAHFLARTTELFSLLEEKEGLPLMPYARQAVDYMKSKYTVALASSTRKEAVCRQLKAAGLLEKFETITTGDMVKKSKPSPEIYLLACNSIGIRPEECVAIEDSPNGIRSACGAGLVPIMVPNGIVPVDEVEHLCWRVCGDLHDVMSIL